MSGRPSWKSAEIGLFRPFSAFFALFRRVRRAHGKSRKRRKKAFFLRYPQICLNPHLLNPHLRHSKPCNTNVPSGLVPRTLLWTYFWAFLGHRGGTRVAPGTVPLRNPKGTSRKACLEKPDSFRLEKGSCRALFSLRFFRSSSVFFLLFCREISWEIWREFCGSDLSCTRLRVPPVALHVSCYTCRS